MKKKYLWLFALIPLVFFITSSQLANANMDGDDSNNCAQYGTVEQNYNGNQGCPYAFDFSSLISNGCTLTDTDLDRDTPGIQHTRQGPTAYYWTNGYDGIIHMLPNQGYGGQGFTLSCDVDLYFASNSMESVTWTCYVNYYPGPYPDPCY